MIRNVKESERESVVEDMYERVVRICGMGKGKGGCCRSDRGWGVMMGDGWCGGEGRGKEREVMFKKCERILVRVILKIWDRVVDMDLKVWNIEMGFRRGK